MNHELWAEEQRLRHTRDRAALLALALWGVGGYLLYLAWRAAEALPDRWGDIAVTGIYLVTFFYVFAFWPILVAVEKLFRRPTPSHDGPLQHDHDHVISYHGEVPERWGQEGGNAIHAASSSTAISRDEAGGTSSSAAGR
jgi:hypothetical protein